MDMVKGLLRSGGRVGGPEVEDDRYLDGQELGRYLINYFVDIDPAI